MPFNMQEFLLTLLAAQSADPDKGSATRVAVVSSMMDLDPVHSMLLSLVMAGNLAVPTPRNPPVRKVANAKREGNRVKVPKLSHHTSAKSVHEQLKAHKLKARIHAEPSAEVKAPRFVTQWPEAEMDVDPDSEVQVVFLVPPEEAQEFAKKR